MPSRQTEDRYSDLGMAIVTADSKLKLVSAVTLMCSKKAEEQSCQTDKISANSRP